MKMKIIGVVLLLVCGLAEAQLHQQREPLQYRKSWVTPDGPIGRAEKLEGAPRAIRLNQKGKKVRPTLSMEGSVFEKDELETQEETKLHVRLIDKTYLELAPSTSVEIEKVRRGGDTKAESIFRFKGGIVRITAPSVESWVHYYVKNYDRILEVKGPSDFMLMQDPGHRDLNVYVHKGQVTVVSAVQNSKTPVPEGQVRQVVSDGRIKDLPPLTADAWSQLKERTSIRGGGL